MEFEMSEGMREAARKRAEALHPQIESIVLTPMKNGKFEMYARIFPTDVDRFTMPDKFDHRYSSIKIDAKPGTLQQITKGIEMLMRECSKRRKREV